MPDIALAVPAYNEQEGIEDTLDAMVETVGYADERWLLDDGSDDDTAAIAEQYIDQHDLDVELYRNEQNGGKVGAIKDALEDEIDTDYVVMMDADSWLEQPCRLEDALGYLEDEELAGVGFSVEPSVQSESLYTRTLEELQKRGYAFGRMLHRFTSWNFGRDESQVRHMAGAGYMVETDLLDEALDEHSYEFDGEDMQTTAILQLGMDEELDYFPDVSVKTKVPQSMRELFSQRQGWNHGSIHTYAEHNGDYLEQVKHLDEPLSQYTLYETLFLTGAAPILAGGVAHEAVQGNLDPALAWYLTDTAVATIGMEAGYQKDELDDRSYMKYLPIMAPYRAAAFFPGKLASYPEFLADQGGDVVDALSGRVRSYTDDLRDSIEALIDDRRE